MRVKGIQAQGITFSHPKNYPPDFLEIQGIKKMFRDGKKNIPFFKGPGRTKTTKTISKVYWSEEKKWREMKSQNEWGEMHKKIVKGRGMK